MDVYAQAAEELSSVWLARRSRSADFLRFC
jgi:hypothetical protein